MGRKEDRALAIVNKLPEDVKLKAIQAMATGIDGVKLEMTFDNLLTGEAINPSKVTGTNNRFTTYSAQVLETYKKYEGDSKYGNFSVRSIVDARSSFIAGEGVSITFGPTVQDSQNKFINDFIKLNRLNNNRLMDLTKTTEMSGYAITVLLKGNDASSKIPYFGIVPTGRGKTYYRPVLVDSSNPYLIEKFMKKTEGENEEKEAELGIYYSYIRTGGYGCGSTSPTTKVGLILTECENYDKALKNMRRINELSSRITPTFKTGSPKETTALTDWMKENNWDHGTAFIGTAEFKYANPGVQAIDNLKSEMASDVKSMASTTSVPVHWLGWVDLMSNRATAEELYAVVNNGTIAERNEIANGIKEIIIKAQQLYIDDGGKDIRGWTDDFEIKLPLIDFGKFKATVEAYSQLYTDKVISLATYRNTAPGVNPQFEEKQIAKEEEEETKNIVTKSSSLSEDVIDKNQPVKKVEEE